ncbi:GDP-mannose mannosyl hydrolase [Solimonas soli]|uniref:GDP-mannose mannosyl hydrolase n=1 Tax=Solimonas soli TaxID=413479 RepID=UPI0004866CDF
MLPRPEWLKIVEHTPLVSIDLIIQDAEDRVLLGWRNNEPARGTWFVPGGVIRKDETLDGAFQRIAKTEIGLTLQRGEARFVGAFEHLYTNNFAEIAGITTHYVVLAHALRVSTLPLQPADAQHREWMGLTPAELLDHPLVHENTKAYFR